MNLVVVFRTAAIGSLMLALLGAGVDLLPGMVPEDLDAAAFDTEAAGQLLILALAALAVGVAGLVATIGLVLFQSWSRLFAVVSTAASLALYPFTPAMAQSGWASMFFYLSAFAWGAAIAMAYFSPLSDRFVRGSSAGNEYRH